MKRRLLKLIGLASLLVSSFSFCLTKPAKNVSALYTLGTTYQNHDADTYYDSISSTSTGNDLIAELNSLNSRRRKSVIGYDTMGTSTSKSPYVYTDYDTSNPNEIHYDANGQPYGETISSFYTYKRATSWNREHVWVDTHGGGSVENDIHMPRPTISSENGDRGHAFYVDGAPAKSQTQFDPKTAGFNENSRGEAARIILYCAIANTNLSLQIGNSSCSTMKNKVMGDLETIMKWHCQYDITERERNRNEGAEYLQGNRKPFIDHPEYAIRIWGDMSSNIESYCANPVWSDAPVTQIPRLAFYKCENNQYSPVSGNTLSLTVGDVVNVVGYVNEKISNDVIWTVTGDSVTYSNFGENGKTFVAAKAGSTTVTITTEYDDNGTTKTVSKSLTINVKEEVGPIIVDGYELITKISDLKTDDKVILKTDTEIGVTGWNNSKDATKSDKQSEWVNYNVEVNGGDVKLKNTVSNLYIAQPTDNFYKEDSSGCSITVDSEGRITANFRVLCINGSNVRFYRSTSISQYIPFKVYKVVGSPIVETKTLTSIEINGTPKDEYELNEELDVSGLTVFAYFSDDTSEDVTSEVGWDYDTSTVGTSIVTCSYTYLDETKTASFTITVEDNTHIDPPPTPPIIDDETTGCLGSLTTSSIIVVTLSILGLMFVLIKDKKKSHIN